MTDDEKKVEAALKFVNKLTEMTPQAVAFHRERKRNYQPVCAKPVNGWLSTAAGYTKCAACPPDPELGPVWHPTKKMMARINGTEIPEGACEDCGGNCEAIMADMARELKGHLKGQTR